MDFKWTQLYGIFLSLLELGMCLKCYQCDNRNNPACGVSFKSYQFEPIRCGRGEKCGLQRQQPNAATEDFIGILRDCYRPGALPGINETDGCHYWTITPQNFTAKFCFCSTDYCNKGLVKAPNVLVTLMSIVGVLLLNR